MKLTFIVALSLLFANPAIAGGAVFEGKDLKGYSVIDGHQVVFSLSGDLAKATYGYMKEDTNVSAGNCLGTTKQFPGFLCSKNEDTFECFVKINLETGRLEGESGDSCVYGKNMAKKTTIAARSMYIDDEVMILHLFGNTAKTLYNKMAVKPIDNSRGEFGCLGGSLKQVDGIYCAKLKNKYSCDLYIDMEKRIIGYVGDGGCPQE
ncbi:MAG: hypothetical protein LBP58_03305 [Azoarcus sp.]|jgi:hypothetical protein|nr:hypothetical protein [Azoarcus sp.]